MVSNFKNVYRNVDFWCFLSSRLNHSKVSLIDAFVIARTITISGYLEGERLGRGLPKVFH